MSKLLIKWVSVALVICMIMPTCAATTKSDAVQPRASAYLTSYEAYICAVGGGEIQVWFDVTATNYMDDLGALSIYVYESTDNQNWSLVGTYLHGDYSNMMVEDDYFHMTHVSYQGVKGRYYYAYVCIWAGKDGEGDARYLRTSVQKAT